MSLVSSIPKGPIQLGLNWVLGLCDSTTQLNGTEAHL